MKLVAAAGRLDRDLREGGLTAALRAHGIAVVTMGALVGVLIGQGFAYLIWKVSHSDDCFLVPATTGASSHPCRPTATNSIVIGGLTGLLVGAVACALALMVLRRRAARVTTP